MKALSLMFLQTLIYGLVSPATVGLSIWLRSRLQARRGPPFWQVYVDLRKLIKKRRNVPMHTSWIFFITPVIVWTCYLSLGFSLPIISLNDLVPLGLGYGMDFLLVIYLLGLGKFVSGLAAFDSSAPFGIMSSGRQLFIHILAEPVLLLVIYTIVQTEFSSNIGSIIDPGRGGNRAAAFASNPNHSVMARPDSLTSAIVFIDPAMLLILLSLGMVFLAESGRLPFDNPGTHLELTMIEQGTSLEYSGLALALMEWAQAMKFNFFVSLMACLAFPWGVIINASSASWGVLSYMLPLALLIYLLKLVVLIIIMSFWEIIRVKLRLGAVQDTILIGMELAILAAIYVVIKQYLIKS